MKKVIRLTESDLIRVVKRIVNEQNETAEADNVLKNVDVATYCSASGVPPFVTNILNKLPENKREEAKQFIKTFSNAVSNKSVKELLSIRKQIKAEKQKAESSSTGTTVNEQIAPIVIAGATISASLLLAIVLILLFIIVVVIITKSSKKGGGCGGPGWWNDL
jgi:hypothetical protein